MGKTIVFDVYSEGYGTCLLKTRENTQNGQLFALFWVKWVSCNRNFTACPNNTPTRNKGRAFAKWHETVLCVLCGQKFNRKDAEKRKGRKVQFLRRLQYNFHLNGTMLHFRLIVLFEIPVNLHLCTNMFDVLRNNNFFVGTSRTD